MLSVSRPAQTSRRQIARTFLATMLLLVVLAGVAPFSSLSSSHECGMACCVGKPSHLAGSCASALGGEEQTVAPDEQGADVSAHDHAAHTDGGAEPSSVHHSTSSAQERHSAPSVTAQVVTKPCSPECAAAAVSSSQVRRPRDAASVALAARPRPPTVRSFVWNHSAPLPKSAEKFNLSRPRAPPSLPVNLSA